VATLEGRLYAEDSGLDRPKVPWPRSRRRLLGNLSPSRRIDDRATT
jgi:hypothetical protein